MWISKLIVGFILIASFSGLTTANTSHAASTVPVPTVKQIANKLGEQLAVDPRVMYPPRYVNCWYPDTDVFFIYCDASHKTKTKHWRTVRDDMYGLHLRLYEDGSFTIRYKLTAAFVTITRRY